MRIALIADELTALGWRLIGARVLIPEAGSVRDCWQLALRDAEFVVITAQYAAAIPAAELDEALLGEKPLVFVIEDLRGEHEPSDLTHEVRHALGVSS